MAMAGSEIMFRKRALFTCVQNMFKCVCIYSLVKSSLKNVIIKPGIAISMPFFGMTLNACWTRALPVFNEGRQHHH